MQLDDLLQVMREEAAMAASEVEAELMAWLEADASDPQGPALHAQRVADTFSRLAQTARVIALEGQAVALEWLRDTCLGFGLLDEAGMGEGLGWLLACRAPLQACFDRPGDAEAAQQLVDYLQAGPMPPDAASAAALQALLQQAPTLVGEGEAGDAALPPAAPQDVTLALPPDLDQGLYDTFLAEAPDQLARLGDAVRALARAPLPPADLVEVQRVAHTFKGSGNIIGLVGVARLAHRIEDLLEFAIERGGQLPAPMAADLEQAVATLDQMVYALRGEEQAPADALQRLQALLDWINAVRDGSWADKVAAAPAHPQAQGPGRVPDASAPAAVPAPTTAEGTSLRTPDPAVPRGYDTTAAEPEAQLRVGASRLERLVRRAGQSLVHSGRLGEHLRVLEDRFAAMTLNHQLLLGRLRELTTALERQGVSLQERADEAGGQFDPLEMDRYNELHALSRFVAEGVADEAELADAARGEARQASAALREQSQALKEQHRELLGARLLPFRQIGARLRRNVSQTAAATGKRARLEIQGEDVQLDSDVLERLTEPLLHLLRNAVDHGIEPPEERLLYGKDEEGVVRLVCGRDGQTVRIECHDDGRGLDLAAIQAKAVGLGLLAAQAQPAPQALMRTILLPGFSTREEVSEVSGRGVGMDVVADRVRALKGHLDIDSRPLEGTVFTLRVPATLGSAHALMVSVGGERWALPTESVVMALAAGQAAVEQGRVRHLAHDARHVEGAAWLGLPLPTSAPQARPMVLVRAGDEVVAMSVDAVLDARELILQDVGSLLRRLPGVAAGALRPDGRVMFVLDVERLAAGGGAVLGRDTAALLRRRALARRKRVLVVDDALSVRKALAQLLEDAGHEVVLARDGFEALDALGRQSVDLVLTDLEMPQLNGLDLTRRLRQTPATAALPVVMITSRSSDKHRAGAAEAGVSHYLTKPYTDADLLALVRQCLASAAAPVPADAGGVAPMPQPQPADAGPGRPEPAPLERDAAVPGTVAAV